MPDPPAAADPTSLRLVVNTDEGVFLVHETPPAPVATETTDAAPGERAYLAYWKDFATEQLLVYGRNLRTVDEVAGALAAFQRDLGFDASEIALSRPDLAMAWGQPGDEAISDAIWSPATRNGLLGLMGFPVPTEADLPDVAFACPPAYVTSPPTSPRDPYDPRAPLQSLEADPYLAPVQSPEDLFRWLEGYVACGGCPLCPNCSDGNPCTSDGCSCGSCYHYPSPDPCCADPECCGDPCCQNPCSCNPFCYDCLIPCCTDPVCCGLPGCVPPCSGECCGDPCCLDRCCQGGSGSPCCGSLNPCCSPGPCCGSPNRCCNPDNPCCGSDDPCCNPLDECCGSDDECCNPDSSCCGSGLGPCCFSDHPCCNVPGGSPCGAACCPDGTSCCIPATGLCCPSGAPAAESGGTAGQVEPCCPAANKCCDDGYTCCGGVECCLIANCCSNGVCCPQVCEECVEYGYLSGGTITVQPPVVCIGGTITFTASGVVDNPGIKRVDCYGFEKLRVEPTYTWSLTLPPDYPTPLPLLTGEGNSVAVVAPVPGSYSCSFTAKAERECKPADFPVGQASVTAGTTATITLSPSPIPASTAWPGMPLNLSQSDITVAWDPPQCVGTLEIVQLDGTGGYVPPEQGTLARLDDTHWQYVAFNEPQTELCAKDVKVWIAALKGAVELTRKSVLVLPVHTYFTQGSTRNFTMDYNYITWKYAAVLIATGGAFTGGVTISSNAKVYCGTWPLGEDGYACTTFNPVTGTHSVVFGTSTFTGSENQAASIIGHELLHTAVGLDAGECPAYRWEADHAAGTGIYPCDSAYLQSVNLYLINHECPP